MSDVKADFGENAQSMVLNDSDLVHLVIGKLSSIDRFRVSGVNKLFRDCVDDPVLWKQYKLVLKTFLEDHKIPYMLVEHTTGSLVYRLRAFLTELDLSGVPLSSMGLRTLTSCENLEVLKMNDYTQITWHSVRKVLFTCLKLKKLETRGSPTALQPADVAPFPTNYGKLHWYGFDKKDFSKLEKWNLNSSRRRRNCARLEHLDVKGCFLEFHQDSLSLLGLFVAGFCASTLQTFRCGWLSESEASRRNQPFPSFGPYFGDMRLTLRILQQCTPLRALDLSGCVSARAQDLENLLPKLPCLELLNLNHIVDLSGAALRNMTTTSLHTLNIRSALLLHDSDVMSMLKRNPGLKSLNASCTPLSDLTLECLGQWCPSLEALDVCCCKGMTARALKEVSAKLHQLIKLGFSGFGDLTDDDILAIVSDHPSLSMLGFGGIDNLTDRALLAVANGCARLEQLYADGLHGISEAGVTVLLDSCTQLKAVSVGGCRQLEPSFVCGIHDKYPYEYAD